MVLDDLRHLGTTAEVPNNRVDYFGYFFEVEGGPEDWHGRPAPLIRVIHPEWYNKFRDERSTIAHWKFPIVGNTGSALERLLFPYMKVPGEYQFEVWYENQVVLRKRFDVYKPAAGAG